MVLVQAPGPAHYAVVRFDPESMVRDLGIDDAATLAEVSEIHPKKYLIYLNCPGELPMPESRWCRYNVTVIATTPRPPDPTAGITSEMVVPIAPNSIPGRSTVYPESSFPFANCVHWFESKLVQIRIRTTDAGFEHDGAIRLSTKQRMALAEGFDDDFERTVEFVTKHPELQKDLPEIPLSPFLPLPCHEPDEADSVPTEVVAATCWQLASRRGLMTAVPPTSIPRRASLSARADPIRLNATPSDSVSETASVGTSCTSTEDDITVSSGTSVSDHAHNPLAGVDLFGWDPHPETPLLPLADLWLDVADHLTQEEIPSPLELYDEVRAIQRVMRRGLARYALAQRRSVGVPKQERKAVSTSPPPESKAGTNSSRTDGRRSVDASQPTKKSYAQTVAKGPQPKSPKIAHSGPVRSTELLNSKPRIVHTLMHNDGCLRPKVFSGKPHTPRPSSAYSAKLGNSKSPARQAPQRRNAHTAPNTGEDSDDPGWTQQSRKPRTSSRRRYEVDR